MHIKIIVFLNFLPIHAFQFLNYVGYNFYITFIIDNDVTFVKSVFSN